MTDSQASSKSRSSHRDPEKIGNPAERSRAVAAAADAKMAAQGRDFKPVPKWYKAVMLGLMVVGLLWIVVFYIAAMQGVQVPIPGIGNWNILCGFGLALIGFIMMMGWRD